MLEIEENIDVWSKWDLHCHSPKSYDYGDEPECKNNHPHYKIKENQWLEKALDKWQEEQIGLVSITDHNVFNRGLYDKINNEIKRKKINVNLIPGLEVDAFLSDHIKNPIKYYVQLIIHINPEDIEKLEKFSSFRNDKIKENEKNYGINGLFLEDTFYFFMENDIWCNISVEGKKKRGLLKPFYPKHLKKSDANPFQAKEKISSFINLGHLSSLHDSSSSNIIQSKKRLIEEIDGELKKETRKIAHFLASDNHCIEIYPLVKHSTEGKEISFFNGRNNFLGLCIALNSGDTKIKNTEFGDWNKKNIITSIFFDEEKSYELKVSKRLNVIIGRRSSGKTLLLKLIYQKNGDFQLKKSAPEYKEYREYIELIKEKRIILKSEEGINLSKNENRLKLFNQSDFLLNVYNKTLKKEYLSRGLSFFEKGECKSLDNQLKPIFEFYGNFKNILKNLYTLLNTVSPLQDFEKWQNIKETEYAKFANNLSALPIFLTKSKEDINNMKLLVSKILSFEEILKDKIKEHDENLDSYNSSAKETLFHKMFKTTLEKINLEEGALDKIIKNINILENNKLIINKMQHRIMILEMAIVNFETNNLPVRSENEKFKINYEKNIKSISNHFNHLGKMLRENQNKNFSLQQTYENISQEDSQLAYNYTLVPKIKYELNEKNSFKESFLKVLYQSSFYNIKSEDDIFVVDTNNLLKNADRNHLKKILTIVKNKNEIRIFRTDDMTYESFKDGIYNKKNDVIIKQNSKPIKDNSPGKLSQIQFDIAFYNLKNENNVFIVLIDQPEDSIDNQYIASDMIEKINQLTDLGKQLFIVTHNPNLIVNLHPDNIIIPTVKEDKIKYVNGRLEDYVLIKEDKKTIINWIGEYIEGGEQALYNRLITYEIGWREKRRAR